MLSNPSRTRNLPTTLEISRSRRSILSAGVAALSWATLSGVGSGNSFYSEAATSEDEIRESLEAIRSRHGLPGLMAGHFSIDGDTVVVSCGKRKIDEEAALDRDDLMHLGSCTKSMTAALVAMYVEEGKIGWDTPLSTALADIAEFKSSPWGQVTMEQMMEHVSGIPGNAPWVFWLDRSDLIRAREEIAKWLLEQPYPKEGNGKFLYSNVGYMLLGHALERIEGETWEEIVQRRLFTPLDMKSAGFGSPVKHADHPSSWGHFRNKDSEPWRPIEGDNPAPLGPAGTVHASLEDWAKYLRVCLSNDLPSDSPLPIGKANWSRLRHAKITEEYAGGWGTGKRGWAGGEILTHNGCNTMWYCVTFLAPEKGIGVFAASNCGVDAAQGADEALQLIIQGLGLA